jgi:hypothetical protein
VNDLTDLTHQIISWLGYIVMFGFIAFTLLTSLYYIGLFLYRLIRRLIVRT